MTKSTNEVYDFIINCINDESPIVCREPFTATIKIKKNFYDNVRCFIESHETYGNHGSYHYVINIKGDNEELIKKLKNHSSFWSNEKYCIIKYISDKNCLKISNINDDLIFFIYPN